jgi:E3 ubiquitin-protein ligase RNF14
LFSWITFLREETLKLIGCDKLFEVTLHPRRAKHNGIFRETDESPPSTECMKSSRPSRLKANNRHSDTPLDQRAVFTNSPMRDKEVLFNFLIEYNQERDEKEFRKGYHTCDVCFTAKSGEDFVRLGCGHFFCKVCMLGCYETHIREGGIESVKCLAVKCAGSPTSRQVHDIVGKDLFERYDKLLLQRALEGMTDLIYCPRAQCGKPVIMEPNEKLAWCFHCLYRFCAICKMVYHGVEPCRFKSGTYETFYKTFFWSF